MPVSLKASEICEKTLKPLFMKKEEGEWYNLERVQTMPVLRIWFRQSPYEDVPATN